MTRRLRLVIFQVPPGLWIVRGLEHDLTAEARTIGQAVRALITLVHAHTEFDARHDHLALSAFAPAAPFYWNAYATGTAIPLEQLGVDPPPGWRIEVAFAARIPSEPPVKRTVPAAARPHLHLVPHHP